jgi:hypothetical protein
VANQDNGQILVWLNGSISPTTTVSTNSGAGELISLFVTITGDIFIYNWYNLRVEKWLLNASVGVPIMFIGCDCYGLFIDISDTLYCSMGDSSQVVARSVNSNGNTFTTFGTGICGNAANMLCYPQGMFVNINFDLYVADSGNNRIQLFKSGQSNATTIIINGASGNITLHWPTGVVLDADDYLFIVDRDNHRIIGSDVNGFRCVGGCSGGGGPAANRLWYPSTLSFDSYGNMFVADTFNNRIQKFILSTNSCGKYMTIRFSSELKLFNLISLNL